MVVSAIHRVYILMAIIFVLVSACVNGPNSQPSGLKDIRALVDQKEYRSAEGKLQAFFAAQPDNAQAWQLMGLIQARLQKSEAAFASFTKAVALDPNMVDARLESAKLLLAAKQYDQARSTIEAALRLAPQNVELERLKGALAIAEGRYDEADLLLAAMIGQKQGDAQTYLMLAAAKAGLKNTDEAEKTFKNGIAAFPKDAALQLGLAQLYSRTERMPEAIAVYHQLMALEPHNYLYPTTLAAYHWEARQAAKADEIISNLIAKDPADPQRRLVAAKFYLERRAFKQAESLLSEGVKAYPHEFELVQGLCEYHQLTGHPVKAIELVLGFLEKTEEISAAVEKSAHLSLARAYYQGNDLDMALQNVEKAVQSDPQDMEALYLKGRIHADQGRTDRAISAFSAVLAQRPEFLNGYVSLAQAYTRNALYDNAAAVLQKGVQVAPQNKTLRLALAKVHMAGKDYKACEGQLVQVLQIDPSDDQVQAELGDFYLALKDPGRAHREYAEIIQKFPDKAVGYIKLARLYAQEGNAKGAVAELRRGYQHNQASQELALELANTYLANNMTDAAVEVCRQRLARDGEEPFAYYLLGRIHTNLKNFKEAQDALQKAVALSPQWDEAANSLAGLYLLQNKQPEAIRRFEAALVQNPKNRGAYLALGRIYEQDKHYSKAIQNYEQAVARIPNFSSAASRLAFLLCERHETQADIDRAYQLAAAANQLTPGQLDIVDTLAWIYHHQGKNEQALKLLQQLAAQWPDHPLVNYHLAMVLLKTGKSDDARVKLELALKEKKPFIGRTAAEKTFQTLKSAS